MECPGRVVAKPSMELVMPALNDRDSNAQPDLLSLSDMHSLRASPAQGPATRHILNSLVDGVPGLPRLARFLGLDRVSSLAASTGPRNRRTMLCQVPPRPF